MNPQLEPLIQLQDFDLRGAEIREERRKIPDLLRTAERPLEEAKRQHQKASATTEAALKARRDREQDLDTQEAQIAKLKARSTEIKKNVEYQAHLFEIQMADKKKGEIEEQILILMDEVEQSQRGVKEGSARVAEAEDRFAKKKAELEALDSKLATELSELDQKRADIEKSIEKALLERYNKLKATRKDLAVAAIKNGTCGGCRLQLPPQLVAEVKRAADLLACSFCHRILYWKNEAEQKTEAVTEPADKAREGLPETV